MSYADVVNQGLILPRKNRYTIGDFKRLLKAGYRHNVARFIVVCSAIYHDTEMSESMWKIRAL